MESIYRNNNTAQWPERVPTYANTYISSIETDDDQGDAKLDNIFYQGLQKI